MYNNPTLKPDGRDSPVIDHIEFLGIIFDKKNVTLMPH